MGVKSTISDRCEVANKDINIFWISYVSTPTDQIDKRDTTVLNMGSGHEGDYHFSLVDVYFFPVGH